MRKVKSNGKVKSQFKSNIKTNNSIKTNPEQLNGVGVFFRGFLRKLLCPLLTDHGVSAAAHQPYSPNVT
ncbi:hypothetical protein [Collimonas arenae]|uniref:hypothetical protein n=1 Tax=Collimonas arenae TaxID=279058 RepID=UPI000FE13C5C|nr:hypothetical protein [Collimonas arenae]